MSQAGVHPGGHLGIGGDVRVLPSTMMIFYLTIFCQMGDYVTSPNDPMFFMHHGYIDYVRSIPFLCSLWTDL